MTLPRERLRRRAEVGMWVTATGGGVGTAGAIGMLFDAPYAEFVAAGGGLVFVVGILLYGIPTFTAWRRGMI